MLRASTLKKLLGAHAAWTVTSLLVVSLTAAETYVAGFAGGHLPNDLSDIEIDDGVRSTNESLQTSLLYGAKLGHYFDSIRWLGVEAEVFNATPHKKQQDVTLTQDGNSSGTTDSSLLRVTTVAVNLLVRYPGERWQPYAGIGPGVFFAHANEAANTQASTSVGLNALAGLRFFATEHVAVFVEWKYNHTTLGFPTQCCLAGYTATYSANMFAFGLGYHF